MTAGNRGWCRSAAERLCRHRSVLPSWALSLCLMPFAHIAAAAELWHCLETGGAATRQFEFDGVGGGATMQTGGERVAGRFRLEHGHLLAVFERAEHTEEVTLGTASGRVLVRRLLADGSRSTVFSGRCRRSGEKT